MPGTEPNPRPPFGITTQHGAPRRFSLSTMLVVTAAFAALFGLLTAIGAPPLVIVHVSGFLVLVGIAQAWLLGGKNPRKASMIGGVVIVCGYLLLVGVWEYGRDAVLGGNLFYTGLATLGGSVCCGMFAGIVMGYLGGILVAGVFLVMDSIEGVIRAGKHRGEPAAEADSDPWTEDDP